MCLTSRMGSMQEVLDHVPGDEFIVFKVLDKQGEQLRSPHYSHQPWAPGEVVADCLNRGNGDAGLYCFLVEPHPGLVLKPGGDHKRGGNRLVRLSAKKEDIVWGGRDSWNGKKGICLVLKKVHLSQEDYDRAMSDQVQEYLVEQVKSQAKADIAEAKEVVEEKVERAEAVAADTQEIGEKVVTKAKRAARKPAKKSKGPDGKKIVAKAKKSAKKPVTKKGVKKSAGGKLVKKAKASTKKATGKPMSTSRMTAGKKLAEKAKKRVSKTKYE